MARDITQLPDLAVEGGRVARVRARMPIYLDRLPPCNNRLSRGENIQEWLRLVKAGQEEAAWREDHQEQTLPAIHGRVCYLPCEAACNARSSTGPSRFTPSSATSATSPWRRLAVRKAALLVRPQGAGDRCRSVRAVGRVPPGHMGHEVEIRDSSPLPGGMMRYGIPSTGSAAHFSTPRSTASPSWASGSPTTTWSRTCWPTRPKAGSRRSRRIGCAPVQADRHPKPRRHPRSSTQSASCVMSPPASAR